MSLPQSGKHGMAAAGPSSTEPAGQVPESVAGATGATPDADTGAEARGVEGADGAKEEEVAAAAEGKEAEACAPEAAPDADEGDDVEVQGQESDAPVEPAAKEPPASELVLPVSFMTSSGKSDPSWSEVRVLPASLVMAPLEGGQSVAECARPEDRTCWLLSLT